MSAMDTRGSFDSLSVDAISAAKDGERQAKLHQQAEANVIRQKNTAALRGDSLKPPGGSRVPDLPPNAGKQAAADKKAIDAASKEHAQDCVKLQKFLTNPVLAPLLAGIQPPRNWDSASVKQTLVIVYDRLNSGLGSVAVKQTWLTVLKNVDPLLQNLPPAVAIPPGSQNYAAIRMRELDMEFEQIAIEYGHWFSAGPIPRLFMKTVNMLFSYKAEVESGSMPLLVGDPAGGEIPVQQTEAPPMAATSGYQESVPQREPPPAGHEFESTLPYDVPELPPPSRVYPAPTTGGGSIVIGDRTIPVDELQAANVALKEERPPAHLFKDPTTEPVFSSDDGPASKRSGGRGRPRKAGL
jgi:hypothetical protein